MQIADTPQPPDWEATPSPPEGTKEMHLTLVIDEHSDPATIARTYAMQIPDVHEAYLLRDDGFGNLSRPDKPIYPKVFDWEEPQ